MRLNNETSPIDPKAVTHVRVDRIGGTGDGLWWVAVALGDGTAKPEGMFTAQDAAMSLASELKARYGVEVRVTTEL